MSRRNYSRRGFLKAAGLGAVSLALPACANLSRGQAENPKNGKPNFVFILVDDLGWIDTACYGSKFYETPNIDRLAAEGMRFTDAYAACAVCSPTRAAVMTGRYPARLGVTDWIRSRFQGGKIPEDKKNPSQYVGGRNNKLLCPPNALWMELDEITIAEALKPAGYTSCHIGKWHLGADDWYPDKQGFDFNLGGCDFGQPPTYFDPYFRKGQGPIPTLEPRKQGEYLTDREADEAVGFIRRHKDKPFFLYMAHYAVHTPIQAKQDLVEKYKAKTPTDQKNPAYAGMIESVDDAVGKIVAVLDELDLADNTIVFFTGDNGGLIPITSNAPLRSGKGYPYEGGIREPLIVRWPKVVKAGELSHEPVTSVDYLPTICEAAGAPLPHGRDIDGVSILEHLRSGGARKLNREALYWHFPHYRGNVVPYSIVRSGDWKLIKRYDGKTFELFNLKTDMSEKEDLSESMPQKVRELDAKLTAWLGAVGAKLPRPNPDYSPDARKEPNR
ncbi:MAG TPA: sulfatase-like hydrolase/transferase [Sedimentisphaerales bacterium]|nr:sulfatase-like hydrolase/transferase [Sedimentisphaerales bacterium]